MRKWIILFSVMFLMMSATAYGAENSVRLFLNGIDMSSKGFSSIEHKGQLWVPADKMEEEFGFFMNYNEINGTVKVNKPSVNVMLARDIKKANGHKALVSLIHSVDKGQELSFYAFARIDQAPLVRQLKMKFDMENPDGDVIAQSKKQTWSTISDGNVFEMTSEMDVHFAQSGEYTVKLQMKEADEEDYVTVGRAAVYVK